MQSKIPYFPKIYPARALVRATFSFSTKRSTHMGVSRHFICDDNVTKGAALPGEHYHFMRPAPRIGQEHRMIAI
jgi:hypothetical protein